MDKLRWFFPKVLEFLEDEMDEARGEWNRLAVLAQSLGWRVPIDWIERELKIRGKLPKDVESFYLAKDHHGFRPPRWPLGGRWPTFGC